MERLAEDRRRAIDLFIGERTAVDLATWREMFASLQPIVEETFMATENLRRITAAALLKDPAVRWHALRYCCGPPVSEEDLWTYVDGPKFKRVHPEFAGRAADVFQRLVDDLRFPWVRQGREPSHEEVRLGIAMTVMPWVHQRFATARRGDASSRQEAAVASALIEAGYRLSNDKGELHVIDELPRGHFSRERKLAGAKCDIPVRLGDGRLLALECKASNGPKNGWKRLAREVGGKASGWTRSFGTQVVTAAVLSGVYDLSLLRAEQGKGTVIFWEHDLFPLIEFLRNSLE